MDRRNEGVGNLLWITNHLPYDGILQFDSGNRSGKLVPRNTCEASPRSQIASLKTKQTNVSHSERSITAIWRSRQSLCLRLRHEGKTPPVCKHLNGFNPAPVPPLYVAEGEFHGRTNKSQCWLRKIRIFENPRSLAYAVRIRRDFNGTRISSNTRFSDRFLVSRYRFTTWAEELLQLFALGHLSGENVLGLVFSPIAAIKASRKKASCKILASHLRYMYLSKISVYYFGFLQLRLKSY